MRWALGFLFLLTACQKSAEPPAATPAAVTNALELELSPPGGGTSVPVDLSGAPVLGPENARLTIVEFSNFRCKPCGKMASALVTFAKAHPSDVRLIFKHGLLGDANASFPVHEAALAAHEQGKFWEFEDLLFAKQMAFSTMQLQAYAAMADLDVVAFNKALATQKHRPAVERDFYEADLLGHQGTPVIYVNGQGYFGLNSEQMIEKLETMLANGCTAERPC